MKKIIIAFLSVVTFLLVKKVTPVQADNDLSSNFTQLKLEDRGQIVHVDAVIDDHEGKFHDGDTMIITWKPINNQLKAQGINQGKALFINKTRIGAYTINDDHALVKFNSNVENYDDVKGRVSFDVQVDNLTDIAQRLMFYAGNSTQAVVIAPQKQNGIKINGNLTQNNIAWEIQINLDSELPLQSLKAENIIPSGLMLDKRSLNIKVDGESIDEDAVKTDKNGLIIDLDEYLNQVITIKYNTAILNSNATLQPNILKLKYQVKGEKNTKTDSYEGWTTSEAEASFTGIYNDNQPEQIGAEKQKTKEKIDQVLAKLFELAQEKNKSNSQAETKATESTTKTVSLPQIKTAGLTGFNSADAETDDKIAANKVVKATETATSNNTAKVNKSDLEKASSIKRNDKILPQAGESRAEAIALLGMLLLLVGYAGFKIKLHK